MKISIPQEKLKQGLNIVERIASKSLTLPILNNILISTEKSFLNFSATDLEVGINWWVLGKVEEQGKITIPSRILSSFVGLLPKENVTIKNKGNNLEIQCQNYKTEIKGLSAEEFPIIPEIKDGEFISINAITFCKSLIQLLDIPVLSTTRPEISGVYFLFQKNMITVAATDSFRLGEKKIFLKINSSPDREYSLILPQKTIKEIINIFGERVGDLKIYFSPNQVMFESQMEETSHPQVQVISRLIEGEYPNYKEIIPKKYSTKLVLNRDEFVNQIKSSSLFSGKVNEVKLKINPKTNKIDISSQSSDIGDFQSSISGKIKGESLEVAFNNRFLLDGLNSIKTPEIIFELNSDSGPGVLKPTNDETYLYVVMPIKSN
ncbi:DNA polymerase III subunit beta [Patescibacteria group bacterium]|nr:DNA polymerase III subunit beta [Patescibacteria group bacterium]